MINPAWLDKLLEELKGPKGKHIVVVGIGNTMKNDDAAGVLTAQSLMEKLPKDATVAGKIDVVIAEDVLENNTGKIRKLNPTHIVILDSCYWGEKPGAVALVDNSKIEEGDVSTHHLPLSMAIKFFEQTMNAKVIIVGIEPQSLEQGEIVSPLVKQAIVTVSGLLADNLPSIF
ncbi:MAG: hydrogenase 3 maturation endopeptidase HyCI [Elusimicrobia bacterium]|nr:hydrogenase 3 maturation endopeptidase HyCI [Elusimicrobiota bacterium]MBU2614839.1 hydrogenase 3 maturation endopeptidase HyCI [Elusimicrobiota bacterium]